LKLAAAIALLLPLQVEEVNLFRERRTHVSKGCGFITMHTRKQAIAVSRQALHSTVTQQYPAAGCWLLPAVGRAPSSSVSVLANSRLSFSACVGHLDVLSRQTVKSPRSSPQHFTFNLCCPADVCALLLPGYGSAG
jgi:hypothetical protein